MHHNGAVNPVSSKLHASDSRAHSDPLSCSIDPGDLHYETDRTENPKWFLEQPTSKHLDLTQSVITKEIKDWEKSSLRGATIAGNYICGAVIGRGSFGTIRIGQAQGGNVQHVAIKLEKLDRFGASPCLDKEFRYLRRMQRAPSGIPVILALTTFGPYRALVMQLLGKLPSGTKTFCFVSSFF